MGHYVLYITASKTASSLMYPFSIDNQISCHRFGHCFVYLDDKNVDDDIEYPFSFTLKEISINICWDVLIYFFSCTVLSAELPWRQVRKFRI